VKSIKSDKAMSKKRSSGFAKKKSGLTPQNWRLKKGRQVFQEKNRGVTPSVAAPGITHSSDATVCDVCSEDIVRPSQDRKYSAVFSARSIPK